MTEREQRDRMLVVFGRPGAGKSTVSEAAVRLLGDEESSAGMMNANNFLCCYLDLDVCVPQWMRDNFAKGIYPTLNERTAFISNACDYVTNEIKSTKGADQSGNKTLVVIISFSFVNTDMRVEFRNRFPHSEWILVDTSKDVAEERILSREDHFYKGSSGTGTADANSDQAEINTNKANEDSNTSDEDNSEWEFKPVDYPHVILDGNEEVAINAQKIVDVISKSFT